MFPRPCLCADGEAAATNLLRVSLVEVGQNLLEGGAVKAVGENGGIADDVVSLFLSVSPQMLLYILLLLKSRTPAPPVPVGTRFPVP